MPDTSSWASNANEAVKICLRHQQPNNKKDETFSPAFTYPIFGEEEVIFGYQDLKIKLDFQADTLDAVTSIAWGRKYEQVGDTKAENIEEKLKPFLFNQKPLAGQERVVSPSKIKAKNDTAFTPPGEKVHDYQVDGRRYGIWSASLADPATKRLLQNMQIFVLFFIEGGTCITLDDPDWTIERWRVFFIYEILSGKTSDTDTAAYSFVGYSTTYRLFYLDTTEPPAALKDWDPSTDLQLSSHLPSRVRISQFLILPPHQSRGHGTHLYTTMMTTFLQDATVQTITVEDPNESFDDLRDYSDLTMLRLLPPFTGLQIDASARLPERRSQPLPATLLPQAALAAARTASKLAPRQFARCVEMHLLAQIPARHRAVARTSRKDRASDPHDRAYYFWRLLVKQRLYLHNLDQLAQLEPEERVQKLEETLGGVEADYVRLLENLERRGGVAEAEAEGGAANGSARRAAKRKIVDEDEDDDDTGSTSSKRARVEDE